MFRKLSGQYQTIGFMLHVFRLIFMTCRAWCIVHHWFIVSFSNSVYHSTPDKLVVHLVSVDWCFYILKVIWKISYIFHFLYIFVFMHRGGLLDALSTLFHAYQKFCSSLFKQCLIHLANSQLFTIYFCSIWWPCLRFYNECIMHFFLQA